MTNLQLFIAIIVPMVFNGALIALVNNNENVRFASMEAHIASLESRFEILPGKVAELTDRVTRIEERLERG